MDVEKKQTKTNKWWRFQTHCLNFNFITGVAAVAQAAIAVVIWFISHSFSEPFSPKITQGGYFKWLETVQTYQDCQDVSPE